MRRLLLLSFAGCFLASSAALAQETSTGPEYRIPRIDAEVHLDGVLEEAAWAQAGTTELAYEVRPGENVAAPVRTEVLFFHDDEAIYFGFRAFDPDPSRIRAHLSDRDAAFRDDFVGVMLDTFGDRRRAWEFFVNPLGIQMDGSRNGNNEDMSWDALWDSAARIGPDGYTVEMAIPFSTLRFARTDGEKSFGFAAFRAWPRTARHQLFAFPLDRDNPCDLCQYARLTGFAGAKPGRNVELVPTLTGQFRQAEDPAAPGELGDADTEVDAGITARWGMTPGLSLGAAINPDFSQVEADAAQLALNERFALFYPEKRPFFLEGADLFETPLRTFYSRTVAAPDWGLKVTGKEGAHAIGALVARDTVTNLLLPSNSGSALASLEQPVTDVVLRYRRDVGTSSTIGVLATSREGDDYSNRVWGADGLLRFGKGDNVHWQLLRTETEYPEPFAAEQDQPRGRFDATAWKFVYWRDSRDWSWWLDAGDTPAGFRADLGFIPRVDHRWLDVGAERVWNGSADRWYNSIRAGFDVGTNETHQGDPSDRFFAPYVNYSGPFQSTLNVGAIVAKEWWQGAEYDLVVGKGFFNIRPNGEFTTSVEWRVGDEIDYVGSRPAALARIAPGLTWNLGLHFYLQLDHVFETLDAVDAAEGRIYRANLTQAKFVWQFDTRTFVRAIVQWADIEPGEADLEGRTGATRDLFTQLLFSWKANPHTVVFVGYSDSRFADEGATPTVRDRTVFVKLGYAWGF